MELRLQKVLAQAGISSRRKAEELISAGRVEVNGQIVRELGTKVDPSKDLVRVDGRLVSERQQRVYFVLYKPAGVVTTFSDPQGRPTISDLVKGISERVFAVGRLDYDAEGALVITNDGDLAHKLMHPSFEVPRTYLVKVKGTPDVATLEKLRSGVRLEDGMAKPLAVAIHTEAERNTWLVLTVAEGRPHLVKRLVEAVGHPALRLYRPQYGGISAEGVRPGKLRQLSSMEVDALKRVAEGKANVEPPSTAFKLPPRRHGHGGDDEGAEEGSRPPPMRSAAMRQAPERGARRPEARTGGREERGGRVERGGRAPERGARRPERGTREESIGVGVTRRSATKPRFEEGPRRFGERAEGSRGPRREGAERGGPGRTERGRGEGGYPRRDGAGGRAPAGRGERREPGAFGRARAEGARSAGPKRFGAGRDEGRTGGRPGGRADERGGERGPRREGSGPSRGGPRRFDDRGGERGPRREGSGPSRGGPRRFDDRGGERGPRREGMGPSRGGPRSFDDRGGERGPRREGSGPSRGGPKRFDERGGERGPRREGSGPARGGERRFEERTGGPAGRGGPRSPGPRTGGGRPGKPSGPEGRGGPGRGRPGQARGGAGGRGRGKP